MPDTKDTTDRAPFEVMPFAGGLWKVLDWKRGRYIRSYESYSAARRYVSARNRKAGFSARAVVRGLPATTIAPPLLSDDEFAALLTRHQHALAGRS